MKLKSNNVQIRMNTAWVNYNCGVRMVGRLRLETSLDGKAWKHELDYAALKTGIGELRERKVELVKEFIENMGDDNFVPALHGEVGFKNPVFPSDGGRYVPTQILVADALHKQHQTDPWTGWAGLVKELSDNQDKYGVEVDGGEFFQNAVMSTISRVWSLTLPKYRNKLCRHGTKYTWAYINTLGLQSKISKQDYADLLEEFGTKTAKAALSSAA